VKVVAIHIAPGRRLPTRAVQSVVAEAGIGLVGDRYHGSRHRHVTIQSQELLDRAADELGHGFDCGATRRNLTVDAGEIPSHPGARLLVGDVELEVVRVVAPCRLLDDVIGPGAAAALRRRAGSACRLLTSGTIRVGDSVEVLVPASS
jgi:MOSC domain-containing protein YiiM